MLLGAIIWFLIYKARLRGIQITITIVGLIGIRVAITVVVSISASVTTTIVISTVSELIVIRLVICIESLISKEGSFAINLLLLLLIRSNRRL